MNLIHSLFRRPFILAGCFLAVACSAQAQLYITTETRLVGYFSDLTGEIAHLEDEIPMVCKLEVDEELGTMRFETPEGTSFYRVLGISMNEDTGNLDYDLLNEEEGYNFGMVVSVIKRGVTFILPGKDGRVIMHYTIGHFRLE